MQLKFAHIGQSTYAQDSDGLAYICEKPDGPTIVGAWSRDVGTMERKLLLALAYPDGEVSPVHEYAPSTLTTQKGLRDLENMDGVEAGDIGGIYRAIQESWDCLPVRGMGSGKCSIRQAHLALTEYVREYLEPGKVFITNSFGNIRSSYLQTVINKLQLGFTRLELQKNFRAWGLLRVNNGTGHMYSFRINTPEVSDWFFSFKLAEDEEGGEAECA